MCLRSAPGIQSVICLFASGFWCELCKYKQVCVVESKWYCCERRLKIYSICIISERAIRQRFEGDRNHLKFDLKYVFFLLIYLKKDNSKFKNSKTFKELTIFAKYLITFISQEHKLRRLITAYPLERYTKIHLDITCICKLTRYFHIFCSFIYI